MSLKAFHIVFVTLSVLLSLGFGLWAMRQYEGVGSTGWLVVTVGALVFAVGLICYGGWFWRKLKDVCDQ